MKKSFTIHDLPKSEELRGRITKPKTKQEWFNFLVENKAYPYFSSKGKVYFVRIERQEWKERQFLEIIQKAAKVLNLKTKEDCQLLRQKIKKELEKRHEYKPAIKKWSKYERPRERLIKYGVDKLSDIELLAILLRMGTIKKSAIDLAREIFGKYKNSFRKLDSVSIAELNQIKGVNTAKIAQIKAALEIGKRFLREKAENKKKVKTSQEIVDYYKPYLRDLKKEVFKVILLDGRNRIIKDVHLSEGSLNSSIIDPKQVIKEAIQESASALIFIHNHPSGESEPTKEDIKITNHLIQICNLMGLKILDHIIIGDNNYTSFLDKGLIKEN